MISLRRFPQYSYQQYSWEASKRSISLWASQLLLIRVLVGSFKEINLSLGLSATVDKSTRGKLQRDQSLFGPLSYC